MNLKKIIQVLNLISYTDLKSLLLLFFLLITSAILEVVSVGSIIPVYKVIIEPDYYKSFDSDAYRPLTNFILSYSYKSQIIIASLVFLVIFFFKTFFTIATLRYGLNFIANLKIRISLAIFKIYTTKNYNFFIDNSSSKLATSLLKEVSEFCDRFVYSFINIVLEFLTILLIIVFLFYIEPDQSISIFILFAFLFYFYNLLIKNKLKKAAEEREKKDVEKHTILKNFFTSIKEIKSNKLEIFFFESYKNAITKFEKVFANFLLIQVMTRPFFEFFILFSLIFFFIIKIQKAENLENVFFTMTILFVAAFRGMPALLRLSTNFINMKFALPSFYIVYNQLKLIKNNNKYKNFSLKKSYLKFNKKFEFKNVSFRHEGSKDFIFENINFKLSKKEKISIGGKSGVGKSTFVDLLLGLLKPTTGQILIDGKIHKHDLDDRLLNASYMPQETFLMEDTVEKNIILGDALVDHDKFDSAIKLAELKNFLDNLSFKEKSFVGEAGNKISGGQKQRISLARTFYSNRDIIIFDEPLNALDPITKKIIFKNIIEYFNDKTVIFILHDTDSLNFFDICYEVKNKKIIRL